MMKKNIKTKKYGKYALVKGFITEGKSNSEDSTAQWTTAQPR